MKRIFYLLTLIILTSGCSAQNKTKVDSPFYSNPPGVSNQVVSALENTMVIIPLQYKSGISATVCEIKDLHNSVQNHECECSNGQCKIEITGTPSFSGAADFSYRVKTGSSYSDWAKVTVNVASVDAAPTISSVSSQTVKSDRSVTVAFTISHIDSPLDCTAVTASSGSPAIVANTDLVVSGTGSNCAIKISPTSNLDGTSLITLTVSDGSLTTSTTFTVSVIAVSSILMTSNYGKLV